jgi:hypothetical protein
MKSRQLIHCSVSQTDNHRRAMPEAYCRRAADADARERANGMVKTGTVRTAARFRRQDHGPRNITVPAAPLNGRRGDTNARTGAASARRPGPRRGSFNDEGGRIRSAKGKRGGRRSLRVRNLPRPMWPGGEARIEVIQHWRGSDTLRLMPVRLFRGMLHSQRAGRLIHLKSRRHPLPSCEPLFACPHIADVRQWLI